MNIDNKKNKLNKQIYDNKELLDIKYKRKNEILEEYYLKNKDIEVEISEIEDPELKELDKYIENTESENKKYEKELEELKKAYIFNVNINKHKTQLCRFYNSPKGCDKGGNCSFAHNEIELKQIMKPCFSGLKCYKKDCKYSHPEGWNFKDNITICEFFKKGYCINEDNCNFKHIQKTYNDKIEDENNNMKDYQEDLKPNNYDYIKEIINNHLHENVIYNIILNNNKNKEIMNYNKKPDISITIDGIKYEDNNVFEECNKDDILGLTNDLQNTFKNYTDMIKKKMDEKFVNDKHIYNINMKIQLNQIMSKIILFTNNLDDIINVNNK